MEASVEQKRREFEDEALVHLDTLYGRALRLTGGERASAEDLVREACVEAYRSWGDHERATNCRVWLTTLLRNAFVSEFRTRSGRPGRDPPAPAERPLHGDVEAGDLDGTFFERLADDAVAEAIDELDDAVRVPLVLSDLEGLGYREIADVLGMPVRTVTSRLHRARRRLQRRLREHARETGDDVPRTPAAGRRGHGGAEARPGDGADGPPGGIGCEEARTRVYEYLDGELEPETQERIHRHLEVCRRCYPVFDVERLFLDRLVETGSTGERSEELQERVRRALDGAGRGAP